MRAERQKPDADPQDPTDEELVERVQAGDTRAFDVLVTRYKAKIYGTLYHMTSNHEDAADLLQDTLIRIFKAIPRFRRDARFSTWVYKITVNGAINFQRSSKRRDRQTFSLDEMDLDKPEEDSLKDLVSSELRINEEDREDRVRRLQVILNEAIQSLSEHHRAAVVMHDVQGMTHAQIAEILDVPEGTVKTRLFHAHRLLQKKLGRHLKED